MKVTPRLAFTILLVLFLIAYNLIATTYNYQARMMPLIIGIPVLLLAIMQLVTEVRKAANPGEKAEAEPKEETIAESGTVAPRRNGVLSSSAWIVGMLGSIYVLGFIVTTFLYPFLYVKLVGGRSWRLAFGVSLGALAFVYVVMVMALNVDLYDGVLVLAVRRSLYGY